MKIIEEQGIVKIDIYNISNRDYNQTISKKVKLILDDDIDRIIVFEEGKISDEISTRTN